MVMAALKCTCRVARSVVFAVLLHVPGDCMQEEVAAWLDPESPCDERARTEQLCLVYLETSFLAILECFCIFGAVFAKKKLKCCTQ